MILRRRGNSELGLLLALAQMRRTQAFREGKASMAMRSTVTLRDPATRPGHHRSIVIRDDATSGAFGGYCFGSADVRALPAVIGGRSALLAELLPIVSILSRRSLESFQNISHVCESATGRTSASPRGAVRKALRRLLVLTVDRRLQDLYRRHFEDNPPCPDAGHEQKIASLELVRGEAQRIVERYGWSWLAAWLELDRVGESDATMLARLSNFAFDVKRVNFRFTHHCNIACRHCYNNSGPDWKASRLALERMLDIVAQMPAAGIERLNLTGGEPFLYPDDLEALIAAGRAVKLRGISIYTNGFWATTRERAIRVLERLAAAGFMQGLEDHLKVSSGVYHEEFIAFDRVLTLARAYHAMFGHPLRVDFELPAEDGVAACNAEERARAAATDEQTFQLLIRRVAPLGRARDLGRPEKRIALDPCTAINQIVFDPDGAARPCCGLNNENHGVVIGGMGAHDLKDLVKRMQNDPILQALAANPMDEMFHRLGKAQDPRGYASLCESCQDALGLLPDRESLKNALFGEQKFYPFWFTLSASQVEGCSTLPTE